MRGDAGFWLWNLFSSLKARAERYRQAVAEDGFETWKDCGADYEKFLAAHITAAERSGNQRSVLYWRDVLASARSFDSPENRNKREAMTYHDEDHSEATA